MECRTRGPRPGASQTPPSEMGRAARRLPHISERDPHPDPLPYSRIRSSTPNFRASDVCSMLSGLPTRTSNGSRACDRSASMTRSVVSTFLYAPPVDRWRTTARREDGLIALRVSARSSSSGTTKAGLIPKGSTRMWDESICRRSATSPAVALLGHATRAARRRNDVSHRKRQSAKRFPRKPMFSLSA